MNDVDDPLFRLVVGVGDKINDLFMLNTKTGLRAFNQNASGLTGCISGDRDQYIEGIFSLGA